MHIAFDNTYARELPGAYVAWKPAVAPAPELLYLNRALADELGLDAAALDGAEGAALFAGNALPEGAEPIAQAYAGHQFGGFSPQLGDGRALLLGELIDRHGQRRDIAAQGLGAHALLARRRRQGRRRADAARGADRRSHARAGHPDHARAGRGGHRRAGDARRRAARCRADARRRQPPARGHLPVLRRARRASTSCASWPTTPSRATTPTLAGTPDRHLALLRAVAERQARLIAQWMNVGFIHGVMNTDNMTISGETIDYGPCAFMEAYDPATVFSSIDHGGRYAYGNQPPIARWNLARLAEALLPLMAERDDEAAVQQAVAQVTTVIDDFPALYAQALLQGQRAKLGLQQRRRRRRRAG